MIDRLTTYCNILTVLKVSLLFKSSLWLNEQNNKKQKIKIIQIIKMSYNSQIPQ